MNPNDLERIFEIAGPDALEKTFRNLDDQQQKKVESLAQSCRDCAFDQIGAIGRALVEAAPELSASDVSSIGWAIATLADRAQFFYDIEAVSATGRAIREERRQRGVPERTP